MVRIMNGKRKSILDKLYSYDKKNNAYVIEVSLDKYEDIYNEWDPTPFKKRDIEPEFVDYLLDSSYDIPFKYNLDIKLYLPQNKYDERKEKNVKSALKSYFNYMLDRNKKHLFDTIARCARSFVIALILLSFCYIVNSSRRGNDLSSVLVEGVGILGWVAMWNVGEEILFKGINKISKRRAIKRLSDAKVEFVYK